jgi:hypothetical protein
MSPRDSSGVPGGLGVGGEKLPLISGNALFDDLQRSFGRKNIFDDDLFILQRLIIFKKTPSALRVCAGGAAPLVGNRRILNH